MRPRVVALLVCLCSFPAWAWAQQPQRPARDPQSVVIVERVENAFVVSPDYKLSRVGGDTGHLAGVTAGYLVDEFLFVGGAVYRLAAGAPGWDLTYGGLVLGVRMPAGDRISFGVKGLAGLGGATLSTTLRDLMPNRDWPIVGLPARHGGRWHMPAAGGQSFNSGDTAVEVSEHFFVFEPQADVVFAVTKHIRFGVSGGYRATAGVDALGDRLNGATGTVSVQVKLGG